MFSSASKKKMFGVVSWRGPKTKQVSLNQQPIGPKRKEFVSVSNWLRLWDMFDFFWSTAKYLPRKLNLLGLFPWSCHWKDTDMLHYIQINLPVQQCPHPLQDRWPKMIKGFSHAYFWIYSQVQSFWRMIKCTFRQHWMVGTEHQSKRGVWFTGHLQMATRLPLFIVIAMEYRLCLSLPL